MSSGITFSGANGIDWNMILNAVMTQEQLPLITMQTQKATLTTRSSAFGTLATKLGALGTAAEALKVSSAFGGRTVTTTDASRVTATAGTDSVPGIYDIVVNELARAQVTASSSTHAAEAIVASSGTMTIGGKVVTVTGDVTLQGLANTINDTADIGVSASVVSSTSGRYRLVLTGKESGSAEAFTITKALVPPPPLAFAAEFTDETTSTSTHPESAIVATGGTLTIGGVAVTVAGDVTLQGLADAINGTASIGVEASVVEHGVSGRYELVLAGTGTFAITNGLVAPTPLAFVDTDSDGISGDSALDNAVAATNAELTVNNVSVSAPTNSIDDAIVGTTLNLLKKDPEVVTVSVVKDDDATKAKVQKFVDTYNDLLTFAQQQTSSSTGIGRDPMLRQLRNDLRDLVSGEYGTGEYTSLAQVGVGFDRSFKLSLDSTLFNEAMSSSAVDVQSLFTGATGVFKSIVSSIDAYTEADGLISSSRTRITDQMAVLDGRLLSMQDRLAVRRASLQREYLAADQMMSQLSSQSGSLSSLGSQYKLF